ncbi:MAG: hypothetical protein ACPG80_05505 [Rickettsiales bacterium]
MAEEHPNVKQLAKIVTNNSFYSPAVLSSDHHPHDLREVIAASRDITVSAVMRGLMNRWPEPGEMDAAKERVEANSRANPNGFALFSEGQRRGIKPEDIRRQQAEAAEDKGRGGR